MEREIAGQEQDCRHGRVRDAGVLAGAPREETGGSLEPGTSSGTGGSAADVVAGGEGAHAESQAPPGRVHAPPEKGRPALDGARAALGHVAARCEGLSRWLSRVRLAVAGRPDEVMEAGAVPECGNARLRALAGRLIAAQEEERRRISLELHDGVGQRVVAACLALARLRDGLADAGAARQVDDVLSVLRELAAEVRGISHAMHPGVLEVAGLAAALRTHCAEVKRLAGLHVELFADPLPRVPAEVATCLYRVAQEALANVVKHAGVRAARLSAAVRGDTIEMEVSDRGRGFDAAHVRAGLGLAGMQERVRMLHGTYVLVTTPGAGTVVRVCVSLSGAAPGQQDGERTPSPRWRYGALTIRSMAPRTTARDNSLQATLPPIP